MPTHVLRSSSAVYVEKKSNSSQRIWALIIKNLHFFKSSFFKFGFLFYVLPAIWIAQIYAAFSDNNKNGASKSFYEDLGGQGSILFLLCFVSHVSFMVQGIVLEKSQRVKEGLLIIGLSRFEYMFSWVITLVLLSGPAWLVVGIFLKVVILPNSSTLGILLSVFEINKCFFNGFSLISFGFIAAALFSTPNLVGLATCTLIFAMGIVGVVLKNAPSTISSLRYLLTLILAPTGFIIHIGLFAAGEGSSDFLTLENWSRTDADFGVSFTSILICQIISTALQLTIGLYLDMVLPSLYGTHKHPLFFLMPKPKKYISDVDQPIIENNETSMKLTNLSKSYQLANGNTILALNELSLQVKLGSTLMLLGQNGSGKSTTIHILIGLLRPSSGNAFFKINGEWRSIADDMDFIRSKIGVCPQYDWLWGHLTVQQTFEVYAVLKNIPASERSKMVKKAIITAGLSSKKDSLVSSLSGGQRRKVSLSIAFMGDSEFVFLDEMCAGVDPLSRRQMWRIVNENKTNRTIIMTTHYMDEADVLGDDIVIIDNGLMKCSGTPLQLKQKYGTTFEVAISGNEGCDIGSLADTWARILENMLTEQNLIVDIQNLDVIYKIPKNHYNKMATIAQFLEENKESLLISRFSITPTSLHDVFLAINPNHNFRNASEITLDIRKEQPKIIYGLLWKRLQILMVNGNFDLVTIFTMAALCLTISLTTNSIPEFRECPNGGLNIDSVNFNPILAATLILPLGFTLVISLISTMNIAKEKISELKQQQLFAGTGIIEYYLINYIWDALENGFYSLILAVSFQTIHSWNIPLFTSWIYLFVASLSITMLGYLIAFKSAFPANAMATLVGYAFFVIFASFGFVFGTLGNGPISQYLQGAAVFTAVFPGFAVLHFYIVGANILFYQCQVNGQLFNTSKLTDLLLNGPFGATFVILLIQIGVYFLLLLFLESKTRLCLKRGKTAISDSESVPMIDNDVTRENLRISNMVYNNAEKDPLVVNRLQKVYTGTRRCLKKAHSVFALRGISFGVQINECFGLLGVNGAGKTSTLKIINGQELPTVGTVYANNLDVTKKLRQVRKNIGVCTQFGALFDSLTVTQHLTFYMMIAGTNHNCCSKLLNKLDLIAHKEKRPNELSGGNRRKLSLAIALIGNPNVLLLDEPSTGMDPVAKLYLWDVIQELKLNRSIILTTHSMEECSMLCNRMGIMANGSILAIGSKYHLIKKFGRFVEVRLSCISTAVASNIATSISNAVEGIYQIEQFNSKITFRLSVRHWKLSRAIGLVEKLIPRGIEHYEISPTSLEEVFIDLVSNSSKNDNE